MIKQLIGVYGASGFGREVMPVLREQIESNALAADYELVFVDDGVNGEAANGHEIIDYQRFLSHKSQKQIVIAIADGTVREKLASRCEADGVKSLFLKASNALLLDDVVIGDGAVLCPFSCITSNVRIGRHFHMNIYSYVAHDCVIGDYVTFAPGVKCNGNVHIASHAYIGTGAILKQGTPGKPLHIGRGAVVGMGAVVTKDVPAGAVVVGNPAKPLLKN